jgi:oxygen-dependent protoporphyrinogen oxidase
MFLRPRDGVERLTDALAERLGPRVRTGARVEAIAPGRDRAWRIVVGGDVLDVDAIVLATEAHVARSLLAAVARPAADELEAIEAASTAVVLMVYGDATAEALPDGSGFVVPRGRAPITASTWLSRKWPSDAFGSRAVVRCYVGGAGFDDVIDADDGDLVEACARHLAALVPLPARPELSAVVRWPASMPQYELGHVERVARIRARLPRGIVVTGQPYDGVGVPDCVRAAGEAAEAVAAHLGVGAAGAAAPTHEEIVR